MARMYSHEAVMKLLETQRKSIMEFEAAKYELMMGGEQKPVEAVSQRHLDYKDRALKRARLQIQGMHDASKRRRAEDRVNKINKLKGQPKKWTAETIHLEIHKIKMEAAKYDKKSWIMWVRKYALSSCQSMRDYNSLLTLSLNGNWRAAYNKQRDERIKEVVVFLQSVIRRRISLK